jgi:chorismate-pyruvate lyase
MVVASRAQLRSPTPLMCPPTVGPSSRVVPELDTLVALFYDAPDELGRFVERSAARLPKPYRDLLAHNHHMTVTVEEHHRSLVDVRVLATQVTPEHYARKILLTRQSDGRVVQFGIVRLNFAHLSDEVRREIEGQTAPVGRILIQHNVLRSVELFKLLEVAPGPDLCRLFGISPDQKTYGRTALIHCDGEPAVELLEIVVPVGSP